MEMYVHPCSGKNLRVNFVLIVRRRPLFYLVNIALTVWYLVLFSFISFRFDAAELGERLQVTLTMVLTLVAFKLSVSTAQYVPITNSISLINLFMIMAFVVVALVALQNYLAFQLLRVAPWFDNASAWALIGLWTLMNGAVYIRGAMAVHTADEGERQDDEERFIKQDCERVVNLLTDDLAIGPMSRLWWSTSGATVDVAMEKMAAWNNLGAGQVVALYKRALEARGTVLGIEHPDTRRSADKLADVRRALFSTYQQLSPEKLRELDDTSKEQEAELVKLELNLREKAYAEHPARLESLSKLADVHREQGDLVEAEKLYHTALGGRKMVGPEPKATLVKVNSLAAVLAMQGKVDEAEQLYKRALKVPGPDDRGTLESVDNLAAVLAKQGKLGEAELMYWRALVGRQKVLGDEHPDTLSSRNKLADVLEKEGKVDKAKGPALAILAISGMLPAS
ncbi:hypothetical protein FOA52_015512 [Chlamydomonas sp. UWO 241]|nr:hypothetical protein FOA52_015512 [Chlamydomonas sp. UWO 241]